MGEIIKPVDIKSLPIGDLGLPTKWWGEVALFSLSDAALLLDYCSDNGLAVLGVEGFRIEGNHRIPDVDAIADFSGLMKVSSTSFAERSIAAMREFLKMLPQDGEMLEFVLVESSS
ncbi:MAG: hypothetical protein LWW96_00620 [Acidovorax sp.]|uniref:hypothetical protein n=1 Tax=Acidovorax sp. TaxID=1872122 RepID=UPI0025C4ADF8|nr:hypothetical protein [Acidovorax sp.]MCE1190633.1 hypothetical protein [Acidovorax sp.]